MKALPNSPRFMTM
jgi:DapC_direct: LL-diaminopimelate aminotransferase